MNKIFKWEWKRQHSFSLKMILGFGLAYWFFLNLAQGNFLVSNVIILLPLLFMAGLILFFGYELLDFTNEIRGRERNLLFSLPVKPGQYFRGRLGVAVLNGLLLIGVLLLISQWNVSGMTWQSVTEYFQNASSYYGAYHIPLRILQGIFYLMIFLSFYYLSYFTILLLNRKIGNKWVLLFVAVLLILLQITGWTLLRGSLMNQFVGWDVQEKALTAGTQDANILQMYSLTVDKYSLYDATGYPSGQFGEAFVGINLVPFFITLVERILYGFLAKWALKRSSF